MKCLKCALITFIFLLPNLAQAAYYGVNFSYAFFSSEIPRFNGFQLMLNYAPDTLRWRELNLYFDGGFSHFWVTGTPYYTTLNIYSIAPVVRCTIKTIYPIKPYFELSLGISYFNHTRLDDRNVGIHFNFQDRIGMGVLIGTAQQFSLGIHAVHYSNAHFCEHNSGITAPLVLDVGYRFKDCTSLICFR